MKKRILPFILLIFLGSMSFASIHTLKVTVNDSAIVCYAAGSFNNWDPTANLMAKISDSPKVFTLDIEVADADVATTEYKFCSGPDWKYQQRQSANFKLSELTAAGDTVSSFQAYYDPGQASNVIIDVLVPAKLFVCYLTGSFNSWKAAANKMDFVDSTTNGKEFRDTIYTLDTTTLEYKFLSGPGWPYQQFAGNYKYMVDGGTVACDSFLAIFDPSKVGDITVNITVPAGTPEVYLIGSFNDWTTSTAIQATKNGDGTYTAVIPMVADVEYKCYNYPDWAYEEAIDSVGNSVANRTASFEADPVVNITVAYWKKVYTPVGIHKVISNTYRVYSNSGSIIAEGVTSGVTIYDLTGRVIENHRLKGTFVSKYLKTGVYIIRIDGQAQKVVVR